MHKLLGLILFFLFPQLNHALATPHVTAKCTQGDRRLNVQVLDDSASYPESPTQGRNLLYFVEYSKDQVSVIDLTLAHTQNIYFGGKKAVALQPSLL